MESNFSSNNSSKLTVQTQTNSQTPNPEEIGYLKKIYNVTSNLVKSFQKVKETCFEEKNEISKIKHDLTQYKIKVLQSTKEIPREDKLYLKTDECVKAKTFHGISKILTAEERKNLEKTKKEIESLVEIQNEIIKELEKGEHSGFLDYSSFISTVPDRFKENKIKESLENLNRHLPKSTGKLRAKIRNQIDELKLIRKELDLPSFRLQAAKDELKNLRVDQEESKNELQKKIKIYDENCKKMKYFPSTTLPILEFFAIKQTVVEKSIDINLDLTLEKYQKAGEMAEKQLSNIINGSNHEFTSILTDLKLCQETKINGLRTLQVESTHISLGNLNKGLYYIYNFPNSETTQNFIKFLEEESSSENLLFLTELKKSEQLYIQFGGESSEALEKIKGHYNKIKKEFLLSSGDKPLNLKDSTLEKMIALIGEIENSKVLTCKSLITDNYKIISLFDEINKHLWGVIIRINEEPKLSTLAKNLNSIFGQG